MAVLGLAVLGLAVLGLAVLGLAVLGLAVLGLAVLGLAVLGLAVLGLAVLGLAVLGLAVLGLAVLGLAVLGLAVLGLTAPGVTVLRLTNPLASSRSGPFRPASYAGTGIANVWPSAARALSQSCEISAARVASAQTVTGSVCGGRSSRSAAGRLTMANRPPADPVSST